MKSVVKWILIGLVLVSAVGGGLYYRSLPVPVEAAEVTPKTAELYFIEQGLNKENTLVEVFSLIGGNIQAVHVKEKQKINAGDVICVLDSSDYVFQIEEMETSIKGYEAQIANLGLTERKEKDSLESTRNNLMGQLKALEAEKFNADTTQSEADRLRQEQIRLQEIVITEASEGVTRANENFQKAQILYDNKAISKSDYEAAGNALKSAETALEQSKQQKQLIQGDATNQDEYFEGMKASINAQITGIDSAMGKSYTGGMTQYYGALIDSGRISIEQLQKRIEDCSIKSPVSGTVTELYIENSNIVSPQTPLAEITTEVSGDVEVYVSTGDIDEINVGDSVELIAKRRDKDIVLNGTIAEIDDMAVVKLSALGVEERKVKVTVHPEPNEVLKPGFDVDVKFTFYREENKITVPKTALFVQEGKDAVWLVSDGALDIVEVEKGLELRTETVVEAGLKAGDFVVADANVEGLKKGVKVKIE